MALTAREIPITREEVRGWVVAWGKMDPNKRPTLEEYVVQQVDDLNLPDDEVDVSSRSDFPGDTVKIHDAIIADLQSYT